MRGGRIHRSRHHQVSSSGAIFRLGSLTRISFLLASASQIILLAAQGSSLLPRHNFPQCRLPHNFYCMGNSQIFFGEMRVSGMEVSSAASVPHDSSSWGAGPHLSDSATTSPHWSGLLSSAQSAFPLSIPFLPLDLFSAHLHPLVSISLHLPDSYPNPPQPLQLGSSRP